MFSGELRDTRIASIKTDIVRLDFDPSIPHSNEPLKPKHRD